jgi:ubiquinol-cytochrome c reductase iron-sulfur subunit
MNDHGMSDERRPSAGTPRNSEAGGPYPEPERLEAAGSTKRPASKTGPKHARVPSTPSEESSSHPPEPTHGTEVAVADDPFADPGLPPHRHRPTDVDKRAAKRAERQVALLFMTSVVASIGIAVSFLAIRRPDKMVNIFPIGPTSISNLLLGLTLGLSFFCIGAGAIHWARLLMSDVELVQMRHLLRSSDEDRAEAVAQFQAGVEESGITRHPLIRRTLLAALGALPVFGIFLLGDLGPLPLKKLRRTAWAPDYPGQKKRLINENTGHPIKPEDITVGSLTSARPEGWDNESLEHDEVRKEQLLNELAKAAVMLIRLSPDEIRSQRQRDKGYQGVVCFSKICTHVGCPLGLYEQQTHHMLCPCHQSTFDMADDGRGIFGPANRSLPQLAIEVDNEGYLVAKGDFDEPVGPSFWERG